MRVSDRACPFCAASLPEVAGADPWSPDGPRLSRSATLLLGAALLATGCPSPSANIYGGPPTRPATPDAARSGPPDDPGGGAEIYGAPPRPVAAADAALPTPAPNDPQGVAAIYGGPPPPAPTPPRAAVARNGPNDHGTAVAAYGAPAPMPPGGGPPGSPLLPRR